MGLMPIRPGVVPGGPVWGSSPSCQSQTGRICVKDVVLWGTTDAGYVWG